MIDHLETVSLSPDLNVAALMLLGANFVEEVREGGVLTGYNVRPADLDMTGYAAALDKVEADRTGAAWAAVRAERNARLTASDWTQLPDAPLTQDQREAWSAYRQALRDLPQSGGNPSVAWPTLKLP